MSEEPLDSITPGAPDGPDLDDDATRRQPADPASGESAVRPAELSPGTVLAGRYRIVTVLGRGGMGEVYRADDLKLDLPVALKFLPKPVESDAERLAQLFDEVKVARQISHPNVCRVYDLGEAEGVHFLSMEYIDGEDLKSLLHRIGRLPWDKAVEIGRQVCDGLGAAHEAGILHRDLKPANLMIDGEGRARITDFGLAAVAASLEGSTQLAGTPFYMAPEQFARRPATVQSDLYALGLLLYELFTGQRVFTGSTLNELEKLHREAPPSPPSRLREGFDPAVEKTILRCLEKDPRARPASAAEVAESLAGAVGSAFTEGTRIATLVASELVSGDRVTERLGDSVSGALFETHDRLLRELLERHGGREIEKSAAGFLLLFERPLEAVRFALVYHRDLEALAGEGGDALEARVGIHLGEVVLRRNPPRAVERGARAWEIEGLARTTATRLMSLAGGRQTLLTQSAFDLARRGARGEAEGVQDLRWLAHGDYEAVGSDETLAVFEVGSEGFAPLAAPRGSTALLPASEQEVIPGWRPAPGLVIPHRPNWVVERKLGEGGFGEVWLGSHRKTHEKRVYKFCYEAERLRSLQREITVFRLLKEELGQRDDIARILDWNLVEPPYFIEFVYTESGSMVDWAAAGGGLSEVPLADRLELVAQVATALAAAHSVGVLHKDVKPANVLIESGERGRPRAVLTDFGIGLITQHERLAARGITVLGMTEMEPDAEGSSSASGTQLYMAPELQAGQPSTIQADIFALGVMLYQLVVGDLKRPLAQGWQRRVDDELLREEIAGMVDGTPARRPANAAEVAERLRALETRRAAREDERRAARAAERAQRRRKLMTTVAAVATVFLGVVSFLAIQALRARADAERRRGQAEQLIDFMLNDLYQGLDKIGRLDLLDSVARGSQVYFDSLAESDETPDARYRRGLAQLNVGDVLLDQGDASGALAGYSAAIELFEGGAASFPSEDRWLEGESLGLLRRGRALAARAETEAALAAYRAARQQAEELAARAPASAERRFVLARAHYRIAELERQIGDLDAAFAAAEGALAIAEELVAAEAAPWRHSLLLIDTRMLLSSFHRFANSMDAALEQMRAALALARRLTEEDPGNAYWRRRLAVAQEEIGTVLYIRGERRAAIDSLRAARASYQGLVEVDPSRVEWRQRLSLNSRLIGFLHQLEGDLDAAGRLFAESVAILEELLHRDPDNMNWVSELAQSHQLVARNHLDAGRPEAAEAAMTAALELRRRGMAAGGSDPNPRNLLSWAHVGRGDVYARLGDRARAREEWTQAVELIEPVTAASDVLMFRDTHAQALLRLGRLAEARPLVADLLARGWDSADFLQAVRDSGLEVATP